MRTLKLELTDIEYDILMEVLKKLEKRIRRQKIGRRNGSMKAST